MEVSVKLDNLEKHLLDILMIIDDSQKIKRYTKYLSNNPLEKTSSQPNIDDSLMGEYIIISPIQIDVLPERKVQIFFNPVDVDLESPVGNELYMMDIAIPLKHWILQGLGQLRGVRIACEVCKLIDGKSITGIGDVTATRARLGKLNEKFGVVSLKIMVKTSNQKSIKR